MRVILEFGDDETDQAVEAMAAAKVTKALYDIEHYCETQIKHGDVSAQDDAHLEHIRDLCQVLRDLEE